MERYQVGTWNAFLATREHGRQIREDIEDQLGKVPPGTALVLDFSEVSGITVSFGDELLAKLLVSGGPSEQAGREIVVEGANDDVRETLETALARRKLAAPAMRRPSSGSSVSRGRIRHIIHAALGSRA